MAGEEEGEPRRELVDGQAGADRALDVGDAVRQRERHLLRRRRAGLAHVVAADADRVPGRQVLPAVGEDVGGQAHRRARREDVGAAGDVFLEDVVLDRAAQAPHVDAALLRRRDVERQQDRRRGVDRHGGGDAVQRDAVEKLLHVGGAANRDADFAHFPFGARVVGVVAHLRRQVEGDGDAGLPLLQQIAIAPVGVGGVAEAGVLAHRPQAAAVHAGLDAAGEGELAGIAQLALVVPVRQVVGTVQRLDLRAGARLEPLLALRRALQRALQRALFPLGLAVARHGPLPSLVTSVY